MDVYRQVKVEKILNNPTIGQKNSPSYGKGFVPTTGFEPARPYEHHPPLRWQVYQFLHVGWKT